MPRVRVRVRVSSSPFSRHLTRYGLRVRAGVRVRATARCNVKN
jgi:hypothetical protein